MQGPVLALDLGTRRIGLALSDADGAFAFPAGHVERAGLARDLEVLRELVEERRVTRIVVGLPLHLDGREGAGAAAARAFSEALARETGRPVDTLDERWTTREAERALRGAPAGRRRRRKGVVDAMAATLLLRTYLERARASGAAEAG